MTEQPVDNKVQLGCGTLIVIAIIVMLFSGGNDSRKLRNQLDDLDRKIDRLENKIDELSQKSAGSHPRIRPRRGFPE